MSFWCVFLNPRPTTYLSNIGVQFVYFVGLKYVYLIPEIDVIDSTTHLNWTTIFVWDVVNYGSNYGYKKYIVIFFLNGSPRGQNTRTILGVVFN